MSNPSPEDICGRPNGLPAAELALSDLLYDLPAHLIAQEPAGERTGSRLLVADCAAGSMQDRWFQDIPEFLREGDLLVLNDTRVLRARLAGSRSDTGGKVEILLVEAVEGSADSWTCMIRPAKRARKGLSVSLPGGYGAAVLENLGGGRAVVRFTPPRGTDDPGIEEVGSIPLPPYIRRPPTPLDEERYQTVYARVPGAVAAPTAGLHFSGELLDRLGAMGIGTAFLTLHVGPGTFTPLRFERIEDNRLEPERYAIGPGSFEAIRSAIAEGRRVVAVGTTTTRVLESLDFGEPCPTGGIEGRTGLFIYPPYRFRAVGALLTNFHLPGSSLMALVAAFIGLPMLRRCYRHAVARGYRFYSYGDAMLVVR
ncbi:tRNA preQ1(34) S-adenosylmethionine ribosyltransferase-isomerase QueA [Candidatus Fermentibacterales bacterium]|nr:tRNA preQ1(34) S-adenosylmethionine ribosyltransferase-isomerase QueA [Candidatus Fermentibacterales bacterium]